MEIGEKIKSLRRAKRMTQTELAGDQITRNMLSLIENGSALPSLPTVTYLSERLGVPAGMLLAREDEELMYQKIAQLPKIKQAYEKGEYRLCYDMCRSMKKEQLDDELYLILSKCAFSLAKENFDLGKLHKCAELLDKACDFARKTIYKEDMILSAAYIYFDYMSRLSPSLVSENGSDSYSGEYLGADAFCKYAIAIKALESGEQPKSIALWVSSLDKGFAEHIKARIEMQDGNYSDARERLKILINSGKVECRAILYDIFKDLEECCRETDDYRGAYEYSVGKVELLERMLREDSF